MFRAAFLTLALSGCASAHLDVVLYDTRAKPEGGQALVDDACAYLDLSCDVVDERYGAVLVVLVDRGKHGTDIVGQAVDKFGCRRTVVSVDSPRIIAHEIGHSLGLKHVDDPARLMHKIDPGEDVTEHELHKVRRAAGYLDMCEQ